MLKKRWLHISLVTTVTTCVLLELCVCVQEGQVEDAISVANLDIYHVIALRRWVVVVVAAAAAAVLATTVEKSVISLVSVRTEWAAMIAWTRGSVITAMKLVTCHATALIQTDAHLTEVVSSATGQLSLSHHFLVADCTALCLIAAHTTTRNSSLKLQVSGKVVCCIWLIEYGMFRVTRSPFSVIYLCVELELITEQWSDAVQSWYTGCPKIALTHAQTCPNWWCICIAPCLEHTSQMLSHGTHSQDLSFSCTPDVHPLVLMYRPQRDRRLSWPVRSLIVTSLSNAHTWKVP